MECDRGVLAMLAHASAPDCIALLPHSQLYLMATMAASSPTDRQVRARVIR